MQERAKLNNSKDAKDSSIILQDLDRVMGRDDAMTPVFLLLLIPLFPLMVHLLVVHEIDS